MPRIDRGQRLRGGGAPLVVAHRGAWRPAPQNSLEALRDAELGCDAIELDVRRTPDGRLVVVHDARLGWRPVAADPPGAPGAGAGRPRAALEEVLDAAAGRIGVDVELKEDGYVEEAMAIVTSGCRPTSTSSPHSRTVLPRSSARPQSAPACC